MGDVVNSAPPPGGPMPGGDTQDLTSVRRDGGGGRPPGAGGPGGPRGGPGGDSQYDQLQYPKIMTELRGYYDPRRMLQQQQQAPTMMAGLTMPGRGSFG